MIRIETIEVSGFAGAFLGMRNPYKNRDKSDSFFNAPNYDIGPKDLELAQKLLRSGEDSDSKFMRMIHAQADINAPLYWWKEFDTYKVATTANSESTMHTIHKKEFSLKDFSMDHLSNIGIDSIHFQIALLNSARDKYLYAKTVGSPDQYELWYQLIQMLPSSYMQKRTVDLSYQTIRHIYFTRRNHKLKEWSEGFCGWVETLPYSKELILHDGH